MHLFQFGSLYILRKCLNVHNVGDIIYAQFIFSDKIPAVSSNEIRTYQQYIHQRHLAVRMQRLYVDDVVIAFVRKDFVICLCCDVTKKDEDKQ